jgi:two-component system, cell cycle response regulator DivK
VTTESPLVLVVDDDRDGREMYTATLGAAGFRVEQATDGFEAVDKGYKLRPDVILMDLLMPRLDGWEVIGWLKNNRNTCDIPIVAVTGAHAEQRELARQAGVHSVLVKPCPPEALLGEIRRLLQERALP